MGPNPAGVLIVLPLILGVCQGCKVDTCQLSPGMKRDAGKPEWRTEACLELKAYNDCVQKAERFCRGNLTYHLTSTFLSHLVRKHNCSRESWRRDRKQCWMKPTGPYKHCGLFGDPHLKTFGGVYQTCRIQGTWSLIDNRHLTVQVTNSPVLDSSPATATTKVTIVIRGRENPCASKKTYKATSDSPLPSFFKDGSDHGGTNGSVYLKATEGGENQRVDIYLRHIDTTLIVRRVGKYLGFSGRFPTGVLNSNENTGATELCQSGCPSNELLDLESTRGHQLSWNAAYEKCKDNSNLNNEIQNNLTDHYLDWCVFDVMTAGNQKDFISAAHSAQADVMKLDPLSLLNRTEPSKLNQYLPTSSAPSLSCFIAVTLLVTIHL